MRKLNIIIYFLFSINSLLFSAEFTFTPLDIDFKGIENRGDTIAAFGNYGSFLISYDNAETWRQYRAFEKGGIIKMFIEDERLVAFSDSGETAVSTDGGISWNITGNINSNIYAVIQYPEGYFIRTSQELITLSRDFNIQNSFPLISDPKKFFVKAWGRAFSLSYFNGRLIATKDPVCSPPGIATIFTFDIYLNPLDTILVDDYVMGDQLFSDSAYLYFSVGRIIYRTQDFQNIEKVYESSDQFSAYFIDGKDVKLIKIYHSKSLMRLEFYKVIDQDSALKTKELLKKGDFSYLRITDIKFVGNKPYLIGSYKVILSVDLSLNSIQLISGYMGFASRIEPDQINDSTFLFYTGDFNGKYDTKLSITNNKGILLNPIIDFEKIYDFNVRYKSFLIKYYDSERKRLYFTGFNEKNGLNEILISSDFGKNFQIKVNDYSIAINATPFVNIHRNIKKNIIITKNWMNVKRYPMVYTYTQDFEFLNIYRDSSYSVNYRFILLMHT